MIRAPKTKRKRTMFKPLALVAAVLTAFSVNAFAAKTELTVYTALEAEQLKTYKQAFEKANPDVEIRWVRDSTGIITAKLLAEKARPQADAVWGLAASSLAILDQQGMLQPYAPKDLSKIGPNYRDAANPRRGWAWTCGPRPCVSTPSKPRSRA